MLAKTFLTVEGSTGQKLLSPTGTLDPADEALLEEEIIQQPESKR